MSRVIADEGGGVSIPAEYLEDSKEYDRQIKSRLQEEVERRLHPRNIATDSILSAYSFENDYVALEALLMVPEVKALASGSQEILTAAIRGSSALELDPSGDLVRLVNDLERSRLVLRSMPEDVTEVEVRKIFEHPECGRVTEIEKEAVTNTWFITFASEMDCLKTHQFLQKNSEFRPGTHVSSRVTERPPPGASSPMVKQSYDAPPGTEPAYEELDAPTIAFGGSPGRGVLPPVDGAAAGIQFSEQRESGEDKCDYADLSQVKVYDTRVFEDALKSVLDGENFEVPWDMAGKDARLVSEQLQNALVLIDPSQDRPPPKPQRGRGRGRGGRGGGRGAAVSGARYYRGRDVAGPMDDDYPGPPPGYGDYYGPGRSRGGRPARSRSGSAGRRRYRQQSPNRYRSVSRTASLSSRGGGYSSKSPSRSVSRSRRRQSPARRPSPNYVDRSPSARRGTGSAGAGAAESRKPGRRRRRQRNRRGAGKKKSSVVSESRSPSASRSRSRSASVQKRSARNRRRRVRRSSKKRVSPAPVSRSPAPIAKQSKKKSGSDGGSGSGSRSRTRRRRKFVKKQRSQSPKKASVKKSSVKKSSVKKQQRSRKKKVYYRRRRRSKSPANVQA